MPQAESTARMGKWFGAKGGPIVGEYTTYADAELSEILHRSIQKRGRTTRVVQATFSPLFFVLQLAGSSTYSPGAGARGRCRELPAVRGAGRFAAPWRASHAYQCGHQLPG